MRLLWILPFLPASFLSFETEFNVVYEEGEEGKPFLFPMGDTARYEIGLKLCKNVNGMGTYAGVRGMLTDGDCAALYHLSSYLAIQWMSVMNERASKSPHRIFRYVETGAYQGLSAVVVATSLESSIGLMNSAIYSHDLFDEFIPNKEVSIIESQGFWDKHMDGAETRLQKFYSNVYRNGFEKTIIPISGPSGRSMKIHSNESAQLVFIDGDHTYEGHEPLLILLPLTSHLSVSVSVSFSLCLSLSPLSSHRSYDRSLRRLEDPRTRWVAAGSRLLP
jgi:hypothetical protein